MVVILLLLSFAIQSIHESQQIVCKNPEEETWSYPNELFTYVYVNGDIEKILKLCQIFLQKMTGKFTTKKVYQYYI